MLKTFYANVCKVEAVVAAAFLVLMVALIFLGGVARMAGMPLVWTTDFATCFFAWACFLCADVAWRNNGLMAVEVLTNRLSDRAALALRMLNFALIAAFLLYLMTYGQLPGVGEPYPQLPGHSVDQLFLGDDEPAGWVIAAPRHHRAQGA